VSEEVSGELFSVAKVLVMFFVIAAEALWVIDRVEIANNEITTTTK
jgi:hypothetical protein